MAAKITDALPTGKGAIKKGSNVCLGVSEAVNINIGNGIVTALSDYDMAANGQYNFDILGYKGNGNWSISMKSSDEGKTYNVQFKVSGTWKMNENFPANANKSAGKVIYQGAGHTLTQSDQSDTIFQKAKVWLDTNLDRHDIQLYIYNSDTYGKC